MELGDLPDGALMEGLMRSLQIKSGTRVLDLGGSPTIWENVLVPSRISRS